MCRSPTLRHIGAPDRWCRRSRGRRFGHRCVGDADHSSNAEALGGTGPYGVPILALKGVTIFDTDERYVRASVLRMEVSMT